MPPTPDQAAPVPAELLDRPDLRQALAEHDFSAAFSIIKKYGGLSQNRIAAACALTPGKVSTILKGTHRVTSYQVISRIADGLRIPGHMVGLTPRRWEQDDRRPAGPSPPDTIPADAWQPVAAVDLALRMTRTDLVMDRRTASRALTAALTTGPALLDALDGWLNTVGVRRLQRSTGRLGARDVDELEQTARVFRQWDHRFGGGLRQKAVIGQLNEVAAALSDHQTDPIEQRLYQVMAQLSETAAIMAWDCGHQRRAQDYYRLALHASHAGEDRAFGANVLAGMARQLLYQDRPQDALELVRLAQEGSQGAHGERTRAMLHTREAWAYAAMGRPAAFHRATEQAREALPEAAQEGEPHWIGYFDQAELAGVTGGRYLSMARADRRFADQAAAHITEALRLRGEEAARSHALDLIGLAEARFIAGDLASGVEDTHRAVDAAARTQSGRVRVKLGALYRYTVGRDLAPVREARDRIRTALAS
ncbi:hypothetical protein [Streptomyces aidingensis]|uniref:HTH cro/C1-type domain-containing protein n=1 Tax=Streptomyces aidingensis TaxID=910347 RepID=A0A1I1PYJ5_9ACTN|nr:hypothetical protein [Streptomyces aidingensis]SFD14742.1 hypothetical protein SAMN05421773_110141 [Streptomyces aidingensis]